MSDFFQQPDEEEKREYLRRELERMEREAQMNGAQAMPVPPPSSRSPRLSPYKPTPIGGLTIQPEEGQVSEDELRFLMEMLITGQK
jgi:hypothetical protein